MHIINQSACLSVLNYDYQFSHIVRRLLLVYLRKIKLSNINPLFIVYWKPNWISIKPENIIDTSTLHIHIILISSRSEKMRSQHEEWHVRHLTSNNHCHSHTLAEDKPYQSTAHKDPNENRHISNARETINTPLCLLKKVHTETGIRSTRRPPFRYPLFFFITPSLFLEGPFWNALCTKCSSLLMEISQKWRFLRAHPSFCNKEGVSISRWSPMLFSMGRWQNLPISFNPRLPGFINRGKEVGH